MTFGKPLLSPTLDAMPPGCPDLVSEYWLQCNKNIENIEHPNSRDSPAIPPLLNRHKVWASLGFFPFIKVPIVPLVKIFDNLLFGKKTFKQNCLESFRRYLDFKISDNDFCSLRSSQLTITSSLFALDLPQLQVKLKLSSSTKVAKWGKGFEIFDSGEFESSFEANWKSIGRGQDCHQGAEKGKQGKPAKEAFGEKKRWDLGKFGKLSWSGEKGGGDWQCLSKKGCKKGIVQFKVV